MVGADLASVVNEAAILAVRGGHDVITVQDFQEAVEKNLIAVSNRKVASCGKVNAAQLLIMKPVMQWMHTTPHSIRFIK